MLLRNHSELKDWYPDKGLAYPAPFPPAKLIAYLPVQDIVYKPPSRIVFFLTYGPGKCVIVKEFKDFVFAEALYHSRHKCLGLPFALIGGINIRYRASRLLPAHFSF
jgi:hypothetical protein